MVRRSCADWPLGPTLVGGCWGLREEASGGGRHCALSGGVPVSAASVSGVCACGFSGGNRPVWRRWVVCGWCWSRPWPPLYAGARRPRAGGICSPSSRCATPERVAQKTVPGGASGLPKSNSRTSPAGLSWNEYIHISVTRVLGCLGAFGLLGWYLPGYYVPPLGRGALRRVVW